MNRVVYQKCGLHDRHCYITAIVLAAGKGKRVGLPKWQLMYKNKTFLDIIISKLIKSGISNIIVVARKESLPSDSRAKVVINQHSENGMISSVFCGIKSSGYSAGYLIFPVDHPFILVSTIKSLVKKFPEHKNSVICPQYNNLSGHPIIIPNSLSTKLCAKNYEGGLKQLIIDNKIKIIYLPTNDENILKNVNTKEDLKLI